MAYLAKDDYTLHISVAHLDEILGEAAETSGLTEDQILENALLTAQSEVSAYLSAKYAITTEFSVTGTSRNRMVMKWVIDLVIFHLHFTINPQDVPDSVEKRYSMTIKELVASRDADINPGLTQNDPFYTRHLLGSNTKFTSKEFESDDNTSINVLPSW